jgi:hypothetical protein
MSARAAPPMRAASPSARRQEDSSEPDAREQKGRDLQCIRRRGPRERRRSIFELSRGNVGARADKNRRTFDGGLNDPGDE